jgi:prepilin-type N-terminal cleavage/methylation domain-containing protein
VSLKEQKRNTNFEGAGITEKKMNKSNKGFSLLELLIVVAIILIIATIAIPSLLRSRQAAHEAAAVATLRTINTAEVTYLSTANGRFGNISDLIGQALISSNFIPGPVSGYMFTITLDATNSDFTVTAEPASANDGRYGYFITPDGTIRYSMITSLAPAGSAGAPVTQ